MAAKAKPKAESKPDAKKASKFPDFIQKKIDAKNAKKK